MATQQHAAIFSALADRSGTRIPVIMCRGSVQCTDAARFSTGLDVRPTCQDMNSSCEMRDSPSSCTSRAAAASAISQSSPAAISHSPAVAGPAAEALRWRPSASRSSCTDPDQGCDALEAQHPTSQAGHGGALGLCQFIARHLPLNHPPRLIRTWIRCSSLERSKARVVFHEPKISGHSQQRPGGFERPAYRVRYSGLR